MERYQFKLAQHLNTYTVSKVLSWASWREMIEFLLPVKICKSSVDIMNKIVAHIFKGASLVSVYSFIFLKIGKRQKNLFVKDSEEQVEV